MSAVSGRQAFVIKNVNHQRIFMEWLSNGDCGEGIMIENQKALQESLSGRDSEVATDFLGQNIADFGMSRNVSEWPTFC